MSGEGLVCKVENKKEIKRKGKGKRGKGKGGGRLLLWDHVAEALGFLKQKDV